MSTLFLAYGEYVVVRRYLEYPVCKSPEVRPYGMDGWMTGRRCAGLEVWMFASTITDEIPVGIDWIRKAVACRYRAIFAGAPLLNRGRLRTSK